MNINKSKIQRSKKAILSMTLILLLALSLMIALAQPSLAQVGVPQPEKTTGYIDIAPRLVGVGQEATINLFIYPIPTSNAYVPYYDGYRGITVTFVKPDGTKDTFKPTDGTGIYDPGQTQALGAIYFFYKPDQIGNWSLSFTMPAQNITDTTGTLQMQGCTSNTVIFTVQKDPVLAGLLNGYPWAELPNSNAYWSYPINSNNREWNQISGDWLGSSSVINPTVYSWQPYGTGPNTAHIVWKQPIRDAGLMGGYYGSLSYGAQSSSKSCVIMEGKLYINIESAGTFECIDLATGKVLYTAAGTIANGYHIPKSPNTQADDSPTGNVVLESSYGHTLQAVLFGGSLNCYDPFSGTLLQSVSNVSSAIYIDGSPLAYGLRGTAPNYSLFEWNLTKLSPFRSFSTLKPLGSTTNWGDGIVWQKPLPQSILDPIPHLPQVGSSTNPFAKSLLGISSDASTLVVKAAPDQYWGYSTTDGTLLWNLTLNYATTANQQICLYPKAAFIVFDVTGSRFNCYSMLTGELLWTSASFSDSAWATTWTVYSSETSDNNNFYAMFPDGTVRAYSLTDGHEIWRSMPFPSTEYPNNAVPFVGSMVMVDGKIYVCAGYSSSYKINPIPRFGMLVCINATTGDTVFTLNGGIRPSSAADGYVIATGDYDGNIYAIGKGPTSTTVSAPQTAITAGTTVTISGSVFDTSSASSSATLTAMFHNGVPAISDANMSAWMDYLYMQNSTLLNTPPNCIGVPVSLTAVDPNGNYMNIGTTTSDVSGSFGYQWTPTTPGLYKVYATFGGSDSYYSSYAETRATVATAAATTTPPPTATSAPSNLATTTDLMTYIVAVGIAIIIAIAIATVLIMRKRA